ncbi:phenylacetate--CoA ligase family protein [Mycobacterium sp. CVI_P3]|uniref:Phenylacetate--CoA ligase family protein n=1 Tax=Mycobacterium pinniadriaticum TaxID=2994102 RepID=A0ABT3SE40_9MYCO|nr:phenylacetate--CoA ligase family protein [Mycobacterium pinniadriaticum]MCX2930965.1 phenylacetate--CoA ligase family protein [Mycobacterium pinniadriaticum]MCX2937389.1 phenylacetate--CoA ligase family protein [Mycobacterium pinniadriaticum]
MALILSYVDGAMKAFGVAWDAWRTTRGGVPAVTTRQENRLQALVAHARAHSRFYAEHYRGVPDGAVSLAALPSLPAVYKPELMARFDEWVTDPRLTRIGVSAFVADPANTGRDLFGEYVVFTTSGSTAEPALLVQDRPAMAVMFGLTYARSAGVLPPGLLLRVLARGARQAAVFATGGHFVSTVMYERGLRAHPVRRRYSRFFSVLDPLPELVANLNEFQPALLGTYASMLSVLIGEQEAGRLNIRPLVISSGGELLLPAVRQRAQEVFGCTVTETYNASEATPLSLPCRLGNLHLNTDWYLVEPIDSSGDVVPAGQRSDSLLLTNLANFVQPLIRYEMGDSVVIGADPCPCGSPLPTVTPEGRTDELVTFPAREGGEVVVVPMAIATVVEETPGVLRYQVIQTAPAGLTVRLDEDGGADRSAVWTQVHRRLEAFLAAQGAGAVTIDLAHERPQTNPRNGKLRHVLRAVC